MSHPQFEVENRPLPQDAGFSPEPPPKSHGCFFYGCIIAIVLFVLGVLNVDTNSITVYYALSEKSGGRLEAEGPLVFTAIPERQEVLVENMGDGLGPESLVENWRKHCAVRNPRNWLCLPSGQSPDIFHMREGRPDYRTLTVILAADQLGQP